MKKNLKKLNIYLISTFIFTWVLWITAMYFAITKYVSIPYNEGLLSIVLNGYNSPLQALLYIVFSLAVYGPFAAIYITALITKDKVKFKFKWADYRWFILVTIYPILVFLIGISYSVVTKQYDFNYMLPLWGLPILLIYQLATSATEELGWRHYLQPLLQKKYSLLISLYIIGLIWSVWHYPFIVYLNYQYGLWPTIMALIGFSLLTIPQAVIMGYLYDRTKSIPLLMFFHAWMNVVSYYILSISVNTFTPTFVVAITTWLVAAYIEKHYIKE